MVARCKCRFHNCGKQQEVSQRRQWRKEKEPFIKRAQTRPSRTNSQEDRKHYYQTPSKDEGSKRTKFYHRLVGYCRKSAQKRTSKNTVNLLQSIVDNLYKRSLATFVFVSPIDNANTPLSLRDMYCDMDILNSLKKIHGNSHDMLHLIGIKSKVCIVTCDYAGLTTNNEDLRTILRQNINIEKVVIENAIIFQHIMTI